MKNNVVEEKDPFGNNKKKNSKYGSQSWTLHQDNSYPRAKYGTYVIVHLFLDDSTPTNGGLIFTRNEPTQQELSVAMQTYKNNNVYRQHLIHNGHINMKNDIGLNINRTRCHYMNVPPKYGNEE